MLSEHSDEEIEVSPGVKVPADNIENIQRKNKHRALERHVIKIGKNFGGEDPEDTEQINSLLRHRSLRMLMEEKVAKTRAKPRWQEFQRVAPCGAEVISSVLHRTTHRRAESKRTKLRELNLRNSKPQLSQLRPVEPVQGERVKYQWVQQESQCTESQQIEPIRIESQWTEFKRDKPQWVELRQVQVEPQVSESEQLDPSQDTPVLLNPVENAQPQYAEIQEVTEVRVVKKIRIYEEIIED